ncbi:MAG: NPCBM/NEW2 domain-containing protein [Blastocatellia bacterium]
MSGEKSDMYLDSLPPLKVQVGYGGLGTQGNLGYEGKTVSVQGKPYQHALSTHPPARLLFDLGGRFATFCCEVAINDDVQPGLSHADFAVLADGREVAIEPYVRAGVPPRTLSADISGAKLLELIVRTSRWDYCHAVWLDPQVSEAPATLPVRVLTDCLGRADIKLPSVLPSAELCIATVVSPGFEAMLDDMLGSLFANGNCQGALLVVFILNPNDDCERVAAKYRATVFRCKPCGNINPMSKALLYSVARVTDAQKFLCLDADMLVLKDLRPVFYALDACPEGSILACREGNNDGLINLDHALRAVYGGGSDFEQLSITQEEASYTLVVNDGIFAGGRAALLALDGVIRSMPQAAAWADERNDIWWRNQFIFNLALARLRCGVELDSSYNVQLHTQDAQLRQEGVRIKADWHGRQARVLHFSGRAKRKYPEWQGLYAREAEPLVGPGYGDGYARFLGALRAWVGRYGMRGLAWSFYGITDGSTARVRDSSTLPLLAMLHYLIRSNGCVRVLESGTARGVSAACLASAVAHRADGQVVTIDPFEHPGREELWAALPEAFRACIHPRKVGSIEGMQLALESGERYDAALLDSIHTEEHVWAEFQLAAQIVRPNGLILIHDVCYALGTVQGAIDRIEDAGYGVVRLWTAEDDSAEDDHLGLGLIENRRRHSG